MAALVEGNLHFTVVSAVCVETYCDTREVRALLVMLKQDVWSALTSSLCGGHCGLWESVCRLERNYLSTVA